LTYLMEANPFILAGAVRSAMRVYRASAATHQMDGFGPPKAGFSRPLGVVMLHLWSARPRREACLTSRREKSVKRVNNCFFWYNRHEKARADQSRAGSVKYCNKPV